MSTEHAGYRGFRGAGARLTEEPLAHLNMHKSSLLGESVHAIHAFDKAHALMLSEEGINTREIGRKILQAFREIEQGGVEEVRAKADGGMHSGEHYLIQTQGEAVGGRLHLGRSSGDLIEVARRMTFRNHVHALLDALCDVREALLDLAGQHLGTVMPGYTHGQHAQPTTFAHWATMFAEVFARDTARLLSFHVRLNRSPAGAAILTGSDFPLNRQRVSDLLGFDEPLPHTMDAILSHDLEMEYASVLAVVAQGLGRIADDLILWSTTEFAMVELPDRYCGTSSIMPQKKNPDGLEDMKSVAARSMGVVVTVMAAEKGPTGFPIMERRNSQAMLWDLGRDLGVRFESMGPLLRDMTVNVQRMHALAGANWAQVTDLAGALVREAGFDWRTSHQIVAVLVRRCAAAGIRPDEATSAHLDEAATEVGANAPHLSAAAFADAMDPRAFVQRRVLYGGPASGSVARETKAARKLLDADRSTVVALRAQADAAAQELDAAIAAFIEQP
ncbi:argininosuccinate lyase [Variovorax sp. J31P207]|uniref:argininosuccinate lyase n=1 Tax=Variovorax sp. J31P207 TaxID=3053510 RepID=UPI00257563B9|nr:argininosuccinate lyase [Variovorax sp. J31P207]MDM0071614.1 argininosuccinate lyase [Variovorax sp. J31P207]